MQPSFFLAGTAIPQVCGFLRLFPGRGSAGGSISAIQVGLNVGGLAYSSNTDLALVIPRTLSPKCPAQSVNTPKLYTGVVLFGNPESQVAGVYYSRGEV